MTEVAEQFMEYECPRCKMPRGTEMFFLYNEAEDGRGRYVVRRHTANCMQCRADMLVESNKMPEEFQVAEQIDGVWDYTAKYRRYQMELARQYEVTNRVRSLAVRARDEAVVRRAREIMADPHQVEYRRRVLKDPTEFNERMYEWLLLHDVCQRCDTVHPSSDFIVRKARGRGNRYEFKKWCASCREKTAR